MDKKGLVDFATKEAQLIWNRYGCMVVANSILLGFIGQLAIQKCYGGPLRICACGVGLLIAFLWLFITSYGWSLSQYILENTSSDELKVYDSWRNSVWKKWPIGPIWFFAHLVILVFCSAYLFLIFHFSTEWYVRGVFIIGFLIGIVIWLYVVIKKLPKPKQKE